MEIENDISGKNPLALKSKIWKNYSKFCEKALRMLEFRLKKKEHPNSLTVKTLSE